MEGCVCNASASVRTKAEGGREAAKEATCLRSKTTVLFGLLGMERATREEDVTTTREPSHASLPTVVGLPPSPEGEAGPRGRLRALVPTAKGSYRPALVPRGRAVCSLSTPA